MMTLQPPALYNPEAPCPKCGSLATTTRLCNQSIEWSFEGVIVPSGCWMRAWCWEHMHRDCRNCGHGWLQRPIDAPAEEFTPDRFAERLNALRASFDQVSNSKTQQQEDDPRAPDALAVADEHAAPERPARHWKWWRR